MKKEFILKKLKEIVESPEQETHDRLKKHYNYKDDEHEPQPFKEVIAGYKRGSDGINTFLWKQHHDNLEPEFDYSNYHRRTGSLDRLVNHHQAPEDLHVYSGVPYNPQSRANSEGIVHHPAYISTSLKKDVAKTFADKHADHMSSTNSGAAHILKIHVPKGHSGAYIGHVGSEFRGEKEFLLPRGLNLKHIKTETEDMKSHIWGNSEKTPTGGWIKKPAMLKLHIHHMEIVPKDSK